MGRLLKTIGALAALAAGGAGLWFGVDAYRHRFVRTGADLVKLLPAGDLTTFYVDLAALRQGGLLRLLSGVQPAPEKDYANFLRNTDFDYTRDLDLLAGATDGKQHFFLARGRFRWEKLVQFARSHGGECPRDACKVPGSKPSRWINFFLLQPDVVALAVGPNPAAADQLRPPGRRVQDIPPRDPIWISVSHSLIEDPTELPVMLRIFATSLRPAAAVVLSAAHADDTRLAFNLQLAATFPDTPSADTTCKQLKIQTRMLQLELARENHTPNPADLTGLLTAGNFQTGGRQVFASWPVSKQLLGISE